MFAQGPQAATSLVAIMVFAVGLAAGLVNPRAHDAIAITAAASPATGSMQRADSPVQTNW
jgi:hypothetical protein